MRLPQMLWRAERWSACAADCDGGTQVRSVHCVRSANSERAPTEDAERRPDYECGLDSRPPTVRSCRAAPCGSWRRTVHVELGDADDAAVPADEKEADAWGLEDD